MDNRSVRVFTSEFIWISLGHAVTVVAGLLSVRLFTELAPREVLGGASLLIGAMTVLINLVVAPLTQTQVRYQAVYSSKGWGDRYQAFILQNALVATLTAILPLALFLSVWPKARLDTAIVVVPLLATWALSTTVRNVVVGRLNAERRQKQYSRFIATEAVLICLATAVLLSFWTSIEAFVAGQIIGLILGMSFSWHCLPVLQKQASADISMRQLEWRRVYLYGVPFAAIFAFEWLVNQTDRYILASYMTLDDVGIYAAAFMLSSRPAMLVGTILSDLFRPVLFSTSSLRSSTIRKFWIAWFGIQLIGSTCIVAMFFLAGELIAGLFLGEAYREGAAELMTLIAAAYCVRAISLVMENQVYALEQPWRIALAKLLPISVVAISAVLLIPAIGLTGAAWANLSAQVSFVIACLLALKLRVERSASEPHAS